MSGLLKMEKKNIKTILIFIIMNYASAYMDKDLIIDLFKKKNILEIVVFSCEDRFKQASLLDTLNNNYFFASIIDQHTINYEIIKTIYSELGHIGFVIDEDCNNTNIILKASGESSLFGDKYPWIIFSTNYGILEVLSQVNINVNAEVTVAWRNETDWDLTDVYNPGFKHGGTLRTATMGVWSTTSGLIQNNLTSIPKYIRRKDLSELTLVGHSVVSDITVYLNKNGNFEVDNFEIGNFKFGNVENGNIELDNFNMVISKMVRNVTNVS